MDELITSLRLCLVTMLVCVGGYTTVVLGFAAAFAPDTAEGSLLRREDGTILGSSLIAQGFRRANFFWPRPSAVDWNASAAGGSNLSPCSRDLRSRAEIEIERHAASASNPLPAELASMSGSGLDPHITVLAARYQAPRVALARGLPLAEVLALVEEEAFAPGGALTGDRLVNVLRLNLAMEHR